MKHKIDPLNVDSIRSGIDIEYRTIVQAIEIFDTIDSTNTYLLQAAKVKAPSGSVCLAESQERGRGRQDRPWINQSGNIYCSLLWHFDKSVHLSGLSSAVAVMILKALQKIKIPSIQLKWPNDIYVNQRKLAGILLESNQPGAVVIGIGLNIKTPNLDNKSGVGIEEILQISVDRNHFIGMLLNELCRGLQIYQQQGLKSFQALWNQHDWLRGKAVTVHTQPTPIVGIAEGINEQGELMVRDSYQTLQVFSYGEVSVRPNPPL